MSDQATPPPPAPQGTQPYGAQPAQPYGAQPAQPYGAPTAVPAAEPEKKKGGALKGIIRYIAILVLVGVGVFVYKQVTGAPETASVGDCMVGQTKDDIKTIDCGDATAEWKVVAKLDDQPESVNLGEACAAYPTADSAFWQGQGSDGFVLCLEPINE